MSEPQNFKANLFYFNNTYNDYELPESYINFKEDIKELFNIDPNVNDEISLIYTHLENEKDKTKKKIVVNTEDDYKTMRSRIQKEIEDKTILIEIENGLVNINRKIPESFEDKIQCIVEREIKNAAERIKKCLSSNSDKYSYSKVQDKECEECKGIIYGNIYKNALKVEEKYYCENCAFNLKDDDPMFIIH